MPSHKQFPRGRALLAVLLAIAVTALLATALVIPERAVGALGGDLQACCLPDCSCINLLDQDSCDALGGDWQPTAVCADEPCATEAHACCYPNGSCEDLCDQDACEALGGDWQPAAVCADDPCLAELQACCFPDGSCLELADQDTCENRGGEWQATALCADDPCPLPGIRVCCLGDDSCELTTLGECSTMGGEYRGGVTTCVDNPCDADSPSCPGQGSCFQPNSTPGCEDEDCCNLVCEISPSCCLEWAGEWGCPSFALRLCASFEGACCLPAIGCVVTDQASCEKFSGSFQGEGTVCQADTCPDEIPRGACCVNGSCLQLTEAGCSLVVGNWQGEGTGCSPNVCVPEGACCNDDGCGFPLTQLNCEAAGGEYKGDDTMCTVDLCNDSEPIGACCVPDTGACYELTESACTLVGGAWQGAATFCGLVECPQPGACCLDAVTCMDMTDQECETAGGTFLAGTPCYTGICAVGIDRGACCIEGDCVSLYQLSCSLLGGLWLGDGTSCTLVTCGADTCQGDTNRDGVVDTTDLINVIDCWGTDGVDCPFLLHFTDVVLDGVVGINDLLDVLKFWGSCP